MKWGRKHRWWFGLGIALAVLALGTLQLRVPKRETFGFIARDSLVFSAESVLTDEYADYYTWTEDYASVLAKAGKELAAHGAVAILNNNFDLPDGTRVRLLNCDTRVEAGSPVFIGRQKHRISVAVSRESSMGAFDQIKRFLHLP